MEPREFTARSVEDALTQASIELGITSDRLAYEVLDKGSTGFLGIGSKEARIRVQIMGDDGSDDSMEIAEESSAADEDNAPESSSGADEAAEASTEAVDASSDENETDDSADEKPAREAKPAKKVEPVDEELAKSLANTFLSDVFKAMDIDVDIKMEFFSEDNNLQVELSGAEMGIIIGKRGQTLDSLQYLTNLAVNKKLDSYVRVKIDTEDYRRRRKDTLENLAHNMAYKVRRSRKPVSLESMNPYERRVIHYALQNDKYVTTHSEGEEPYRHVVISLK